MYNSQGYRRAVKPDLSKMIYSTLKVSFPLLFSLHSRAPRLLLPELSKQFQFCLRLVDPAFPASCTDPDGRSSSFVGRSDLYALASAIARLTREGFTGMSIDRRTWEPSPELSLHRVFASFDWFYDSFSNCLSEVLFFIFSIFYGLSIPIKKKRRAKCNARSNLFIYFLF